MKEPDKLLRDSIGFIERELFEIVKDRGVGDDCDVKGVSDRGRQHTGIHWVRV